MNEKLKPCPFCGREAVIKSSSDSRYYVMCGKCEAKTHKCIDKSDAVKAWNRRVEKESSLPVEYEADGYDDNGELIYDTAYCPNCRNEYEVYYDYHDNYCRKCGQKLDWRTDNG